MTLALTHGGYLLAGWGIGLGALAAYAVSLARRGRRASQHVAPEDRRWS